MGLIDLAGLGGVLKAIFLLYWLLAIGLLGLAAVKPKTRLGKGLWVASVLAVFGYLPVKAVWQSRQARKAYEAREERHLNAYFLFQEHCKNAGVKIHHTVEGVKGIYLMKVRTTYNQNNQYAMNDPYGDDGINEDYIIGFLIGRKSNGQLIGQYESRFEDPTDLPGYRFVEAADPKDGKLYRYTLRIERPGRANSYYDVSRDPIDQRTARYGVTYDDISTKEDRDYWVAGSSLRVVDLETNEVIAERIGYMVDYGQGPNGGMRQGWTYATRNACPAFPGDPLHPNTGDQTRNFVEQSLHIGK